MRVAASALVVLGLLGVIAGGGCGHDADRHARRATDEPRAQRPSPCPGRAAAPALLPGVSPRERTLVYWLERTPAADEVLMSAEDIAAHDQTLAAPQADGKPLAWADLLAPVDPSALAAELTERLGMMRERLDSGDYVDPHGARLDARAIAPFRIPEPLPALEPRLHVALANIQLRCGPRSDALYKRPVDATYNRNNCSTVRPQEPVRVLMRWPNGPRLVRSRHALGWIDDDAPLSPPVPDALATAIAAPPTTRLVQATTLVADDGARVALPAGTFLPAIGAAAPGRLPFATADAWHESRPVDAALVHTTRRALTRRAVLETAFAMLDTPYGWGGERGGRDCSGFVLDVFSSFGLQLPRDSGRQALAGTDAIAVDPAASEHDRLALIDEASRRGVVLLHFPGHIMLYLGRTESGTPMVIHAFAEYLEPCTGGGETLRTVDRVTVSDLSLGRGTSRRSFAERITRIVVLGHRPPS